jgi:hypothetical protein
MTQIQVGQRWSTNNLLVEIVGISNQCVSFAIPNEGRFSEVEIFLAENDFLEMIDCGQIWLDE